MSVRHLFCARRKLEMAFAFDTLDYAKRLEAAGVARPQAEAFAEAFREFAMPALVAKQTSPSGRRISSSPSIVCASHCWFSSAA
jgi:hypothetical protein